MCLLCLAENGLAQRSNPAFRVIGFYTAKNDRAHISFVHEANRWFPKMAATHHFSYDSTNNWNNLNARFLADYDVVIFLDTRPEEPAQREAFRQYMEQGGGWMGFHFAAFALTPSTYPQNWDWYHTEFLGSGSYKQQHLATDLCHPARGRPEASGHERITQNIYSRPQRMVPVDERPAHQPEHRHSGGHRLHQFSAGHWPQTA